MYIYIYIYTFYIRYAWVGWMWAYVYSTIHFTPDTYEWVVYNATRVYHPSLL